MVSAFLPSLFLLDALSFVQKKHKRIVATIRVSWETILIFVNFCTLARNLKTN